MERGESLNQWSTEQTYTSAKRGDNAERLDWIINTRRFKREGEEGCEGRNCLIETLGIFQSHLWRCCMVLVFFFSPVPDLSQKGGVNLHFAFRKEEGVCACGQMSSSLCFISV